MAGKVDWLERPQKPKNYGALLAASAVMRLLGVLSILAGACIFLANVLGTLYFQSYLMQGLIALGSILLGILELGMGDALMAFRDLVRNSFSGKG